MRMSCNGCRVLRKGCSENCSIRPCLDWIKSPESQANATVFLAKFYGRAGLINLINAGPPHLRPAIFRSLLYEACGRIANPVYGSVGLMWTGSWPLCQTAVEAILKGDPITQVVAADVAETKNGTPLKAYDIRHVNKEETFSGSNDLNLVRTRCRFKRSGKRSKPGRSRVGSGHEKGVMRSPSHESSLSHQSAAVVEVNRENGSLGSGETSYGAEPGSDTAREVDRRPDDDGQIELDLTLGFVKPKELAVKGEVGSAEDGAGICKMELGLQFSVFSN